MLDGREADEVGALVVAPALADAAIRLRMGDASEAVPHADAIVRATVDALRSMGIRARGHIGAADPAVAVSDGLRTYDADRVIVNAVHVGAGDEAGRLAKPWKGAPAANLS